FIGNSHKTSSKYYIFFFQAEDGIRDRNVTGVQTCALPILKDSSPKMTALGKGTIAEEIIQKAASNDIPVLEDPSLVALLSELNINETIPEELYQAVAEVFAFIYRIDQQSKL